MSTTKVSYEDGARSGTVDTGGRPAMIRLQALHSQIVVGVGHKIECRHVGITDLGIYLVTDIYVGPMVGSPSDDNADLFDRFMD